MFGFSNYSAEARFCYDTNKLLVGKMKNKTDGAAIKEFIGLFLVDDSSEYKKAKGVN